MTPKLKQFIQHSTTRLNQTLETALLKQSESSTAHPRLLAAMRYSLLSDGKRFRPCLTYAAAQAALKAVKSSDEELGEAIDKTASAVEIVHTYSLIHDDLPAMDDDDLRRGQATCHIAFDEATAILAGDALQSLAFEQLASIDSLPASRVVQLVSILAKAIGPNGMVLGQSIDLDATGKTLEYLQLKSMHQHKTGDLIVASVAMGALASGCDDSNLLADLSTYGKHLGLAFQIQDDLLDTESNTDTLGKKSGADSRLQKPTYTSVLGVKDAREALHQAHRDSLVAIAQWQSEADILRDFADHAITRKF